MLLGYAPNSFSKNPEFDVIVTGVSSIYFPYRWHKIVFCEPGMVVIQMQF